MGFEFSLEKILHLVRLREMAKKLELASLVQSIQGLERRKVDRQQMIRKLLADRNRRMELGFGSFDNSKVVFTMAEIRTLERDESNQRVVLEQKRKELSTISMRRKSLENLKDRRRSEWNTEQSRLEQKHLDEIYELAKVSRA